MSDLSNSFSNNPYSANHLGSADAGEPNSGKLKGSTKAFAIVTLVLGLLGLFSSILSPLIALASKAFLEQLQEQDPNLKDSMPNMGLEVMFHPVNLFLMAITFFASIALLVGSIGVLRRKRSGASILRGTCGGMAVLTLVQAAFGTWMQLANKDEVLKSTEAQFNRTQGGDIPPGMETIMEAGFYLGMGFSIFLAMLFVGFYVWAFFHFGRDSTLAQFPDPSTAPAY